MANSQPPLGPVAKARTIKLVDEHVGLDEDEAVLLLVRKHWHIFRNSLFIGLFIPFVLLSIAGIVTMADLSWSADVMQWMWAGVAGLSALTFIIGMVRFLWQYHMWSHTFYVMTTKKLAIINLYRPFSYEAQQISLSNINDITIRQEGVQAFLYHYSDVIAITFSGSTFVFEEVGHATQVQKAIMQQLAKQDRPQVLRADNR